jgi:hypothetical protein
LGGANAGRDHHGRCFTVWLAGAGVKPGIEYGRTDDFCYNIAENPVHLRDLHATMLHILGIDHNRFTYPFRGLDVRSPASNRPMSHTAFWLSPTAGATRAFTLLEIPRRSGIPVPCSIAISDRSFGHTTAAK